MRCWSLSQISVLIVIVVCLQAAFVPGQDLPLKEIDIVKCWEYAISDTPAAVLATDGDLILVGNGTGRVDALSADGKKLWSSELGGFFTSNLLATPAGLYVVTSTQRSEAEHTGGSVLRSLSKITGITNWSLKLSDADRHFLAVHNGEVLIASLTGEIQSNGAGAGGVKWKRKITESFAATPVFQAAKVHIASNGMQIFTVLLNNGEIETMRKATFPVSALGQTATGELVVGDERGNLSLFTNGIFKAAWKFKAGGQISEIVPIGVNLLVTSHDNFVYYLASRNGDVLWKKRLISRILPISTLADKYAMISSFEDELLLIVDLSNGKVAGQIAFAVGETVSAAPVTAENSIIILTNKAVYSYSPGRCGEK